MSDRLALDREGTRLSGFVVGAGSPPVLLLHGLAGYAGEWSETIGWLGQGHRVAAFDARGHGESERDPEDVSRQAHVADAAHVIEQLGLAPCVVIGQSLGGVTALLLAAERPDLVSGLIVGEAAPILPGEEEIRRVGDWLAGWPVPFAGRTAAVEFFGGPSLRAEAWAGGLDQREDGWWPRFDPEVMLRTLTETSPREFWDQWGSVSCPTLVVGGEDGSLTVDDARRMGDLLSGTPFVTIPDAGHDLHLEQPLRWRAAVEALIGS
jgi:pimeloyl-ACP methyl ester carboxylesterase